MAEEHNQNEDWRERTAEPAAVRSLYRAGLLGPAARDRALALLRPPRAWWRWADRLLLLLGAALVLAGVVFFFAYNWERLSRFLKFGLLQTGIVICVAGAHWTQDRELPSKVFLLAASVLVGPLLAVYGQAYQTGADAFELFVAWAALILPWVVAARFAGLWVFWLGLVNVASILYWVQVLEPNRVILHFEVLFIFLALVNAWALGGGEAGRERGYDWLAGRWPRWLLLAAVLFYLTAPTLTYVVEPGLREEPGLLAAGLWIVAAGAAWYFYRRRYRDLPALSLAVLSACTVLLTLVGKMLFQVADETWTYLFFGLIILGVMSLAVYLLRRAGRRMAEKRDG
ncbi:MAG: DUF2157 domain-containing protein [Thermodesulfobacteriota bacterium]